MRTLMLAALAGLSCAGAIRESEPSTSPTSSAASSTPSVASSTAAAPTEMPAGSAEAVEPVFPRDWVGDWYGTVTAKGGGPAKPPFGMELHIAPIADTDRHTWTIVYDLPEGKQTRAYELETVGTAGVHYRIDEKNGIVIDAFLIDATLYTQFSVGNSLLTIRYIREADGIVFDLVSTQLDPPIETGGGKVPAVAVYLLQAVQRAVLLPLKKPG